MHLFQFMKCTQSTNTGPSSLRYEHQKGYLFNLVVSIMDNIVLLSTKILGLCFVKCTGCWFNLIVSITIIACDVNS